MIKKIRQINEHLDKKLNLDLSKKYYINKNIFRGVFLILLVYLAVIGSINGFGTLFKTTQINCPAYNTMPCINPLYDTSCKITGVQCEQEFIKQGESIGTPVSKLHSYFGNVAILLLIGAFLLNYLDYKLKQKRSN